MPRFTVDQVRSCMDRHQRVRNMSVIAHVDHGKTTLTDSLVAAAGFMNLDEAGDRRLLDTRPDEAARGITIKSASISLLHRLGYDVDSVGAEGDEFLINLIDCPGHVDFSSEVTAALRVTDGALVVVDCVEGVCVQTETVLRQALAERIVPVLMVNKLDRAFLELQLEPEEAYRSFSRAIESCNAVIGTYQDSALGDVCVDPVKGTVAFGAGLHGWAFTLRDFARIYAPKWKMDEHRVMQLLWGDHFFDDETRKWTTANVSQSGAPLQRGFVKFVLNPIVEMLRLCMDERFKEDLLRRLETLKITLKPDQLAKTGKALMKTVMQRFLPAADSILNMVIAHLPSPAKAQQYRVECLYEGDLGDKYADAIRRCDPSGPLIMFVSKMVPTKDNSRFIAFGRVFSGTIKGGAKVRIMGGNYVVGKKEDVTEMNVQRVVVMMGRIIETVTDVPCGNVVGLVGIDSFVVRSATIVDDGALDAYPLKAMMYSVAPVVRVAVKTKNAADLPKLVKGLRHLAKSDFLLQLTTSESGEHIVAGVGELHLEIALKDLKDFMGDTEIEVSAPVVQFRETITTPSSMTCLAKSSNKHNRVFVVAEPVPAELANDLESGKVSMRDDPKTRAKFLVDHYKWDPSEARKIWTFGPEPTNENILVDTTKAVQYLTETRDSFVSGFQWATKSGVLCEEPVRGMRINIVDAMLHRDSAHRGGDQVMPMARRAYYAAMLTANPVLLEPMYLVSINAPQAVIGSVYNVLSKRRGEVIAEEMRDGTPMVELRAYLPVLESFSFAEALRQATAGQAFPQAVFDHWQQMPGSIDDPRSLCFETIRATRLRKGLSADIPPLDRFLDRL